jgi:hypothetical protein
MNQIGMARRLGFVLGLTAAFLLAPTPGRADVKTVRLGVKGAT